MLSHRDELAELRQAAANALRDNVYAHYEEFIGISKEIAQMESDMLVLRGLLSDISSDIGAMKEKTRDVDEGF